MGEDDEAVRRAERVRSPPSLFQLFYSFPLPLACSSALIIVI